MFNYFYYRMVGQFITTGGQLFFYRQWWATNADKSKIRCRELVLLRVIPHDLLPRSIPNAGRKLEIVLVVHPLPRRMKWKDITRAPPPNSISTNLFSMHGRFGDDFCRFGCQDPEHMWSKEIANKKTNENH